MRHFRNKQNLASILGCNTKREGASDQAVPECTARELATEATPLRSAELRRGTAKKCAQNRSQNGTYENGCRCAGWKNFGDQAVDRPTARETKF
ncbi:MAG: hypothetical protein COV07_02495 [Candidatus Vogelbacteria bacterium CG10_big_fil_rev_8_21_14_0_10_45_14]|uniref:Uncharacterized protein n=1 Tax=Candidatus Vogelbacteria bacterium CG10_big_fil_rev_8_21_14_0_10_45_14 TaxID=1975042 RepID=A0A2H0RK50_9BACT|nr:MAG: hypothetical protein COV07_02495 [Candidatus Vogelbacteria bacterium CG10_big_fil_rev_8_21_14_0_10_45_14]